ncbi:Tll0287-like domain-containing protein [Methylomonas methanica]|uniref:Cytochrome c family protein n=1 Tax=Methylomonas methanica (strain DSM 25384 / MC09) TaxID=857087 RepID=F9ZYQ8_METMM|nr:DUF3365 domain-containing protein [Methylomonas methanica]AEF98604.1 cytochrome c family protein [Methylomonas methanica MC09]
MKSKFTHRLLPLLFAMAPALVVAGDNPDNLEESRRIAQAFMQRLGGTLKQQLATAGPGGAIGVCKQVAPALAADYSRNGFLVSRVSLKTRNKTLGTPDAWERSMLEQFDRQQAQGSAPTEVNELTEDADGRWFRYLKAIPTQPMCLQCHGQPYDMAADVKTMLAREYPDDQATGYRAGDIRGAISIKRKLADAGE